MADRNFFEMCKNLMPSLVKWWIRSFIMNTTNLFAWSHGNVWEKKANLSTRKQLAFLSYAVIGLLVSHIKCTNSLRSLHFSSWIVFTWQFSRRSIFKKKPYPSIDSTTIRFNCNWNSLTHFILLVLCFHPFEHAQMTSSNFLWFSQFSNHTLLPTVLNESLYI